MRATPLALLLAALPAMPAAAETVHDEQVWLQGIVIGTLPNTRLAYFAEVQPRYGNGASELQQLLLRGAVGYKVSDAITLYGGFMHVVLPRVGADDRHENRAFTQLSWTLPKHGAGALSLRTRLERRRLSNGSDAGWRVRQMVRYTHPLGDPRHVRALVSEELFVALNDTDWGATRGFDQARTFVGVELPLKGRSTIEAGYMDQTINDPGGRIRMNHAASLSVWVRP